MIHHNDHFIFKIHFFIFKIMRLCMGSGFLVLHCRVSKLRHFYGLSPLGTMSNHNWWVFHSMGDLSQLVDDIFSLPFQSTVRLYWTLSHLAEPTQSNTKISVDLPTMHSHPFNAMSQCICNVCAIAYLYHVTYMMNAIWAILSNMHITNASWAIISNMHIISLH